MKQHSFRSKKIRKTNIALFVCILLITSSSTVTIGNTSVTDDMISKILDNKLECLSYSLTFENLVALPCKLSE